MSGLWYFLLSSFDSSSVEILKYEEYVFQFGGDAFIEQAI